MDEDDTTTIQELEDAGIDPTCVVCQGELADDVDWTILRINARGDPDVLAHLACIVRQDA